MSKRNPWDPANAVVSPLEDRFVPPPEFNDIAKMFYKEGGRPLKATDPIWDARLKLPASLGAMMDDVLSRRVLPVRNRQEYMRALIHRGLSEDVRLLQDRNLLATWYHMERLREAYANAFRVKEYMDTARYARGAIIGSLSQRFPQEAYRYARRAKRVWEQIEQRHLRDRFNDIMLGATVDGTFPADSSPDEASRIWLEIVHNVNDSDVEDEEALTAAQPYPVPPDPSDDPDSN
jgi:hypothetical protein